MQQLRFEQAWDKTIAEVDRKRITRIFKESTLQKDEPIQLTRLSQAKNHKGELLVTVLVHNTTQQTFSFYNKQLRYIENKAEMATHIFTSPAISIEPLVSMPWTFIFPVESIKTPPTLLNGHLEIIL
ncbi:SLAP domain-containing protein [Aquibacillus rhizosphaerae]|uniref:SLAP domain-containing protein n=1 Tax=Aquibacillus rhizosphaerae TaxID=3051431 RepID=A0ABT7L1C8_9BACI|nr:SLAP domain-containing protein [Aquibacillus sp. LR5S19]MDL4839652.1 SLAP domain-containing protein [Aquibacillus sp. LR5S19]